MDGMERPTKFQEDSIMSRYQQVMPPRPPSIYPSSGAMQVDGIERPTKFYAPPTHTRSRQHFASHSCAMSRSFFFWYGKRHTSICGVIQCCYCCLALLRHVKVLCLFCLFKKKSHIHMLCLSEPFVMPGTPSPCQGSLSVLFFKGKSLTSVCAVFQRLV